MTLVKGLGMRKRNNRERLICPRVVWATGLRSQLLRRSPLALGRRHDRSGSSHRAAPVVAASQQQVSSVTLFRQERLIGAGVPGIDDRRAG